MYKIYIAMDMVYYGVKKMGLKIFLKKNLRISGTPVLKCKWFKV